MAIGTKVIAIGDALGIILPEEMLTRLKLAVGDTLYLAEFPGGIQLTAHDEEFAATMEAARRVMLENYDVLKRLAE
jgi:putative addiction module antidote